MPENNTLINRMDTQRLDIWMDGITTLFTAVWPFLAAFISIGLAVWVTIHVAMNKRDARAAAAWAGLAWLVPVLGAILYWGLGVNRIRRRARQLTGGITDSADGWRIAADAQPAAAHLHTLSGVVGRLTQQPLTSGNRIQPLSAAETINAMIGQINQAQECVHITTYIFDNHSLCRPLCDAMGEAVARGVKVRLLIDGVGALYSIPSVVWQLRRAGVIVERFLHSVAPWRMPYMNLRNHRKIMIVDRKVGFTGGMNIRAGYLQQPAKATDLHALVEGPVVGQLLRSFAADWFFTTGEMLETSYAGASLMGSVLARGISAGPDADFDKRRLTLLAAISAADHRIRIVTPYFVPDKSLLVALQLALLKGVKVEIVLPSKNNLRMVHWAGLHALRWLVAEGVELTLSAAPFDHSKVMTVDGHWVMLGSGNWDARSLRLNFEFDLECYDPELAEQVDAWITRKVVGGQAMDKQDFSRMAYWRQVRNALAHLFEPYL